MRKLMVLAATLAMALVVASPATANTFVAGDLDGGFTDIGFAYGGFDGGSVADDGSIAQGGNVLFLDASQRQFAFQVGAGDTIATADNGSAAFAEQDLSVDQSQFNAGSDDGGSDGSGGLVVAGSSGGNGFGF